MEKKKCNEKDGLIPIPDVDDIGEWLTHQSPLPIAYYWHHQYRFLYGCGCCCCCGMGAPAAINTPAPAPAPTPVPTPVPTPRAVVQLDEPRFVIRVVGGAIGAVVSLGWQATGAAGLSVNIEVKRPILGPAWQDILTGQPPIDVGTWNVVPLVPGEREFHFRAVATDSAGNRSYSNIRTVRR